MIVKRTEKSISDITKHEIVAKFIMEIKAVQDISRMPSISALSESVKKICPELESAINKLLHHLETFLEVLESNEEAEKEELLKLRISNAINDFSKEASNLLPQPDLLKIVESFNHHHGHIYPKPTKKVIYNAMLFEKTLECLHFERITPHEAKLIALSLHEDKVFERILLNSEADTHTEADSDQFSLSLQSSQPNEHIYSQEFHKNTQHEKLNRIPPNTINPSPDSLELDGPLQAPDEVLDASHSDVSNGPPELLPMVPLNVPSPDKSHHTDQNILEKSFNRILQNCAHNEADNGWQFAQSSAKESDSDEIESSHTRTNPGVKHILNRKNRILQSFLNHSETINSNYKGSVKSNRRSVRTIPTNSHNGSDSDTSDCEKNPEFRFLTPTLFKVNTNRKTVQQCVWLSDNESNDSSVITTGINSQQNDPNWSTIASSKSTVSTQPVRTKKNVPPKKKAVPLPNSDSDSDVQAVDANENRPDGPSSSAVTHANAFERPTKKRRLCNNVKLYRSPNVSIDDFVDRIRHPVPAISNEVPVHRSTNTPAPRKKTPQAEKKSNKRQKCKQCDKAYKTAIALRRHVFLKHTAPPNEDSDCD